MACYASLLYLVVLWLKWLVTRSVRDIYETAKSKEEIEQRLRGLVEYMKWKSEETLSVYQHYFDEQSDAELRDAFHRRLHEELRQYLEEYGSRTRGKPVSPKHRRKASSLASQPVKQLPDEPDLAFLYRLGGEVGDGEIGNTLPMGTACRPDF